MEELTLLRELEVETEPPAFLPWLQNFQSVRRAPVAAAIPDWRGTLLKIAKEILSIRSAVRV